MLKPKINELYTLDEGGDIDSRVIISATPITMSIMVPKAENGLYSVMARITWLCKDRTGVLFCLTSTYAAENEEDEEFLVSCPLSNEKYFIHNSLTADILMSSLDHFLTDFNFKFKFPDNIHNSNETEIFCQAFERSLSDDPAKDKLHKIMVTPEVYATLSYVDHYILKAKYNASELYYALKFGVDESSTTKIFEVNEFSELDVRVLDKHKNNGIRYSTLAIFLHVYHNSKHNADISFGTLYEVPTRSVINKKVKQKDFEELFTNFMLNDMHYSSKYSFDTDISERKEDKNYTFIRVINKDDDGILVALSNSMKEKIVSQIMNLISETN